MRLLTAIIVAAGIVCAAHSALAQPRGAASKITGTAYQYPYFYNSAAAYHHSAFHHAFVLREASQYDQPVPSEVAREHTAAIRRDVQAAQRKYAGLRKMAGDHKQVNAHLDQIDAHHKNVLGQLDKVDAHVKKNGQGEPGFVSEAMHEVTGALKSAQAEHEKMMKHFAPPAPKKQ